MDQAFLSFRSKYPRSCKEIQQQQASLLVFKQLGISCWISGLCRVVLVVNVPVESMTKLHLFNIKIRWCNSSMDWMMSIHKSELKSWWWSPFLLLIKLFLWSFKKRNKEPIPSVKSTALAVKNQGFNQSSNFFGNVGKGIKGNRGKGRPICNHCGKVGHVMEKCYKLVGFPPGYKQKGKVSMAN